MLPLDRFLLMDFQTTCIRTEVRAEKNTIMQMVQNVSEFQVRKTN